MEDLPPDAPPVISPTKQSRILIWRDEVATALTTDQKQQNHHQRSSDAASSSATSSTTTSASSSSSRPARLLLSRSRNVLLRIARRLSPNHEAYKFMRDDLDEGPPQTAMYSRVPPQQQHQDITTTNNNNEDDDGDAEAQLERQLREIEDEDNDEQYHRQQQQPNISPVLREKQERLMRAARLLDHGVTMTA